jgi:hypothetical protein
MEILIILITYQKNIYSPCQNQIVWKSSIYLSCVLCGWELAGGVPAYRAPKGRYSYPNIFMSTKIRRASSSSSQPHCGAHPPVNGATGRPTRSPTAPPLSPPRIYPVKSTK